MRIYSIHKIIKSTHYLYSNIEVSRPNNDVQSPGKNGADPQHGGSLRMFCGLALRTNAQLMHRMSFTNADLICWHPKWQRVRAYSNRNTQKLSIYHTNILNFTRHCCGGGKPRVPSGAAAIQQVTPFGEANAVHPECLVFAVFGL